MCAKRPKKSQSDFTARMQHARAKEKALLVGFFAIYFEFEIYAGARIET
jgi:hypothetical protein